MPAPQSLKRAPRARAEDRDKRIKCTDLGNAERFVKDHGGSVRFCHAWGKWLTWNGKHWEVDDTGQVYRLAKMTVRGIYAEAARAEDDVERLAIAKHAKKSESLSQFKAMIGLAESEEGVPVKPNDLDANPWLLNVLNGSLDLRTGELKPHSRDNFITKLAPVAHDPNATCPTWLAFLEKAMAGRESLIAYMQKAVGYALTGDTREKNIVIFHGGGDNGKTILTTVISAMLGDYAQETPVETLMIHKNESIPNDIARLKGERLVTASEGERGQRLAESLIKRLSGGDKITARFLHQEFFEFIPTFKIWLSTNHKPVIRGSDNAIWNRIHLIPFDVSIPKSEQIPRTVLLERLREEWPGILAWAVKGCLLWQQEGLDKPEEVEQATANFRAEMDVIGGFISDCCIVNPLAKVKAADLYGEYLKWCEANREGAVNKRLFGSMLQERGCTQARK